MCDVWKMVNIVTHKKNVYTMYSNYVYYYRMPDKK